MNFSFRYFFISLTVAGSSYAQTARTPTVSGSNTSAGHSAVTPTTPDDTRTHQVEAATVNAKAKLKDQIRKSSVSRSQSVGDVIDRTRSDDALNKTVDSAKAVGSPRWPDPQTCEVTLDMPGQAIADLMTSVQKDHPAEFQVKPDDLQHHIAAWARTRFSTVGTAVGSDAVGQARPTGGSWADVTDDERKRVFLEARGKAVSQMLDAIGPIPLTTDQTVADALKKPVVKERVTSWLTQQPVTKIETKEDLQAVVTIFVKTQSLGGVIKTAVKEAEPGLKVTDWDAVQKAVEAIPAATTGTATAKASAPVHSNLTPTTSLPPQPTDLSPGLMETEATAPRAASRLLTRHAAEAAAVAKLRTSFVALHVAEGKTLADVAAKNPDLARAIDQAMLRVRASTITYADDGSVTVKVQFDPQVAWDDLRSSH